MAGRVCTECGHEVSTKDGPCGHCGAPKLPESAMARVLGKLNPSLTWGAIMLLVALVGIKLVTA